MGEPHLADNGANLPPSCVNSARIASSIRRDFMMEPGPGRRPSPGRPSPAISRAPRRLDRAASPRSSEARPVLLCAGRESRQPVQGVIERQQIVAAPPERPCGSGSRPTPCPARPPRFSHLFCRARSIRRSPHGLGGGGKKVATILELLVADQPQIGLMNQSGRLQRVTFLLVLQSR